MAKVLRCKDVGMDCDFVARAESEEELLKKAAEHAAKTHNMKEIPAELKAKLSFKVNAASEKAKSAIEAAGGRLEIVK